MQWLAYLAILAIAGYTWNYANWCRVRGMRRGAAGLAILGAFAAAVPVYVLNLRR